MNLIQLGAVTDIHAALVERCKTGNRKAQYELYRLYSRAMFNIAMRITRDYMDAEDVLQEAFVKAFRSLHKFKGDSTFGAWLKRIVINTSINHLNKKKDIWADIDKHAIEVPEEESSEKPTEWDMEIVRTAIMNLPEG